jgi:CheY-like chemotaxis protein
MPEGGRITVETASVTVNPAFAEQHVPMLPGEYSMLAVRDSGSGMDTETLSRVFEPFFTTKSQGQGTGMGLSTVYGIVKQSGGYIWVESEPGQGSSFLIYLPRAAESTPRERAPSRRAADEKRGSETILVVEDEDLVRAMTRRTLERTGYSVREARNGAEALEIARELGDALDLLVTDIVMPVMGGRELATTLQRERPGLRILFMSGYTNQRQATAGDRGMTDFMHKPFTLDELRGRVRSLLDRVAAPN